MVAAVLLVLASSEVPVPPPAATIRVPAPIRTDPPSSVQLPLRTAKLALWQPGSVRCEGQAVAATMLRRPDSTLVWSDPSWVKPVTLRFSIDRKGRPFSITRDPADTGGRDDRAAPALAASSFAAGSARQGCSITYTADVQPVDRVAREEIASYLISRQMPALPEEAIEQLKAGDGCLSGGRTQPLMQAYPDFDRIPATPGVRDWALVGFDVDAAGKTGAMRVVSSTGNAALDRASAEAIGQSRFNAGAARSGCLYPYWRAAGTLPAPAMPEKEPVGTGGCAVEGWAVAPRLAYPPAYQARSIEGWAILEYDLAPWGEIGNVRVVEAQPSADFGVAAKAMLELARKPAGQAGVGCTTRVLYKMPVDPRDRGQALADPADGSL